jgi:hypothetical protein
MAHHGKLNRTKITTADPEYHKLTTNFTKKNVYKITSKIFAENAIRWHECTKSAACISEESENSYLRRVL